MIKVKGYSCGWNGSVGASLSGFQRVARRAGRVEPTDVSGKKGQGRAATLRGYNVHVERKTDGKRLEGQVGPAYWSRKRWKKELEAMQVRLLKQLGWKGS